MQCEVSGETDASISCAVQKVDYTVRPATGEPFTITLTLQATVKDAKEKVAKHVGEPPSRQILLLEGEADALPDETVDESPNRPATAGSSSEAFAFASLYNVFTITGALT